MQTIAAYDNDPKAIQAYTANWETGAELADLYQWRDMNIPDCDGIIAGSPCQDASQIANNIYKPDQGRSDLLIETARIIDYKQPAWAILENVPNMAKRPEYREALDILTSAGYWVSVHKLTHADYGGTTMRERLFVIASRRVIPAPQPTYSPRTYRGHGGTLEPLFKQRQPDGWGKTVNLEQIGVYAAPPNVTFNCQIYQLKGRKKAWVVWEKPYFTITKSSAGRHRSRWQGGIYRLNDVEISAVAGFPTWFHASQEQVGNAVPPELARAWGRSIRAAFGDNQHIVSLFCGAGGLDFIQDI